MTLNTSKETICIKQIVGQKNSNITVEEDMIVPDIKPDILNIISASGTVCIYKKEAMDNKIRLDGSVSVYIMYMADNQTEELRSLNTNLDFTEIVDFQDCMANMNIDEQINVKDIECKILNGRKINIKAMLDANIKIYLNNNIDIIDSVEEVENLQTLRNNLEINSLLGEGTSKVYAKDTIIIDNIDDLAEILKMDIKIVNKDTKTSYNKVLAKADAQIKILYLTEDGRINTVENNIPVMGFIDMPNVNDEHIIDMKYKLKNFILKPNSTEEHSIYIEAELELTCFVYEKKNVNVIQDMYSPIQNLQFNQRQVESMCYKDCIKDICIVKDKIIAPEISGNRIYDVEVMPNILSKNISNGRINFEGEVNLKYIFEAPNNSINTKNASISFNFSTEVTGINSEYSIETTVAVLDANFVMQSDGTIDNKIDLEFTLEISKKEKINIIEDVMLEESREDSIYSMVIYFVKPGDTLWKIAKQFKTTVQDIANLNEIEDVDRINVGMQLFIPKYRIMQTV